MKKFITLLNVLLLCFITDSFSQTIPIDWVKNYNGMSDNTDIVADMTIDAAANVYVTGTSLGSTGSLDIVTVKYDINGNELWAVTFNGVSNDNDQANDLWLDAAGNVYVTGRSKSTANLEDLVVIKYDNAGNQQWAMLYNGTANLQDEGKNVETDASGNVYVCGYTSVAGPYTDWLVIKYNSSGTQQWAITYNGLNNGNDDATDLVVDQSGNPIVTGTANDINGTLSDIVTKKFNPSNGSTTWTATYNGTANDNDYGKLITMDQNGNLFVAGRTFVTGYWFNYITLRYDPATGSQLWATPYGYTDVNTNVKYEEINGLIADSLGNVYITGQSQGNGNQTAANDIATIKYNLAGVQQWVTRYTSSGNFDDRGLDITLDDTLNVYITGYRSLSSTNRDMITIKYTPSGTQVWLVSYNAAGNALDESRAIEVYNDGSVFISGTGDIHPSTSLVNDDYITIKYSPQNTSVGEWSGQPVHASLFPNPSNGTFTIQVEAEAGEIPGLHAVIYDPRGTRITEDLEIRGSRGNNTLEFENLDLPSGLYYISIRSAEGAVITMLRLSLVN